MPCFRYPGGKSKIKRKIIEIINNYYQSNDCYDYCEYVEPFFGAGAIGISFISSMPVKNMMIADADPSIASFWQSVIRQPDKLCQKIENFTPSIEYFYEFKDFFLSENFKIYDPIKNDNYIEVGFRKIALHQMSYSGLGPMSGGPLGGKKQKSSYKIDCRWNPLKMIKDIKKISDIFNDINVYNNTCMKEDFSFCFKNNRDLKFLYLDPPYYEKGDELYQYSFSLEDHIRLKKELQMTKYPWLLSYDNNDKIKKLYDWAHIEEIPLMYTINAKSKGRKKTELLITSHEYKYLLDDNGDIF